MAALLAATLSPPAGRAADALTLLSLGSGELDGGYHGVAMALCDAVNARAGGALRCSPETTPGSRYNLDALLAGQLDMALVQSDIAARAFDGAAARGFLPLRRLASLYAEPLTALVREGFTGAGLGDLRGRIVDVGPPGSGRNATVRHVLAATGLGGDFFGALVEEPGAAGLQALCAGRVDAMILVVGHPSALVAEAIRDCGARLLPLAGPQLDALAQSSPAYTRATIDADAYGGGPPIPTIAVRAMLLTRADVEAASAETIVGAIVDALPALGRATPLLAGLTPALLAGEPDAPLLHDGAAAAFAAAR